MPLLTLVATFFGYPIILAISGTLMNVDPQLLLNVEIYSFGLQLNLINSRITNA
jgi:hypothetical protein